MPRKEIVDRIKYGEEGIDYIRCAVEGCGGKFRVIDKHVGRMHGLPLQEYRTLYPEALTICSSSQEIFRRLIEENIDDNLRTQGRENARKDGLLPYLHDEGTRALEQAKGKVRVARELAEAHSVLNSQGLTPLKVVSAEFGIPDRTLYTAVREGRLEGKRMVIAGRAVVGVKTESLEQAFQTGKMKRRKTAKE